MKFYLEIVCDNAAFEDDPHTEVARILDQAADLLLAVGTEGRTLRDYNGNTVGSYRFEDEEDGTEHTHVAEGQTLIHRHPLGDLTHGYYQHTEDGTGCILPGETYNGAEVEGSDD